MLDWRALMKTLIKQVFVYGLSFGMAILILGISIATTIDASNNLPIPNGVSNVLPTPTMGVVGTNNYYLAYPGVLPDNILYKVKMVRDRLRVWTTRDDLKKANLYLLYADKRLNAARFLVEGSKSRLGVVTASKSGKYLDLAYNSAKRAEGEGKDIGEFWTKLESASEYHVELLTQLSPVVDEVLIADWERTKIFAMDVSEKIKQEVGKRTDVSLR